MANEQNLKPITKETAREYGRKGGLATAKVTQRRKTIKQALKIILNGKNKNAELNKHLEEYGEFEQEELTNAAALALRIYMGALNGDPRMMRIALEVMGEVGKEKEIRLTGANGGAIEIKQDNPYASLSDEELMLIANKKRHEKEKRGATS